MSNICQAKELYNNYSLMNEIRNTCTNLGTHCYIKPINTNELRAYTDKDNIIHISKGILDNFTEDEIRSIAYHEVAHLALKHPQYWQQYVDDGSYFQMSIQDISKVKHTHEYQADSFASFLLYMNHKNNNLDIALQKLVPVNYRNIETKTHPSTNSRLNHIRQYKRIYNDYNWSIE